MLRVPANYRGRGPFACDMDSEDALMLHRCARGALLAALMAVAAGGAIAEDMEYVGGREVIPGRLLIRLAEGGPADGFTAIGFAARRRLKLARAQVWQIPPRMSVERALRIARRMPGVEAVEPDFIRTLSRTPNDPDYFRQFALPLMDLPAVWDFTTGSHSIIAAVIDTGIELSHPDLIPNLYSNPGEAPNGLDSDGNGYVDDVHGWDFVGPSASVHQPDNDPSDFHGHGTTVSGIIGGAGNNALGVAGVNWNVSILPLKVSEDSTSGKLSTSGTIEAMEYAVAQGCAVINASYGGSEYSHFELEAIQAAQENNVLLCAAAGNDTKDLDAATPFPMYPAGYNLAGTLSVAATTSSDSLASYSNWGVKSVDLAAPGSAIWTTQKNHTYGNAYGTSFSAPQMTGIAALLRSQFPEMNVRKLRLIMMEGTEPVSSLAGKMVTGARANAYNSLQARIPWARTVELVLPEPLKIPDNRPAGITSTIAVPHDLLIRGVTAFVEVDHPWMDDIGITLQSPAGTINQLESPAPDDNNHGFFYHYDTQFDFRGENAAGAWTLKVSDHGPKDVGYLIRWGLEIYYDGPAEDVNGDGTVNVLDLIAVRNSLRGSPGRTDVNGDGVINVLDLISIRNKLGLSEDD